MLCVQCPEGVGDGVGFQRAVIAQRFQILTKAAAHVIIDGIVNGDIVRSRYGQYLESLGDDGALEPDAIAEAFWALHTQHRSAWTHELDLRPFKESW